MTFALKTTAMFLLPTPPRVYLASDDNVPIVLKLKGSLRHHDMQIVFLSRLYFLLKDKKKKNLLNFHAENNNILSLLEER